jgi:hypothetical protein
MMPFYGLPLVCPESSPVLWTGVSKLNSKTHTLKVKILSHVLFSQSKCIEQENTGTLCFLLPLTGIPVDLKAKLAIQ